MTPSIFIGLFAVTIIVTFTVGAIALNIFDKRKENKNDESE